MADPKMLPPSLRSQKRYIVFEVISDGKVAYPDIVTAVWASMLAFIGEAEASKAKIWTIKNLYSEEQQKGVIRAAHDHVEHVRAALSLIQVVGESKSVVRVIGVTGTIKAARNKYLEKKEQEEKQS
ncbi:MAG: ribonuclease P protein component 2 [Candidatus Aenigmarchaeota archaeon]|nr:ribonuclease P protein component 2 [Candidatus Aenigmarchaeota archaeon]